MIHVSGRLVVLCVCISLCSCNTSPGSINPSVSLTQKSPEQLRQELRRQEQSSPIQYLSAHATIQENQVLVQKPDLFHHSKYAVDGWIINGTISSTASIAKFKDVVLTISFYSETQTVMDTKQIVIYKYFTPNSTTPFDVKVYPPDGMKNFGIQISNATALY